MWFEGRDLWWAAGAGDEDPEEPSVSPEMLENYRLWLARQLDPNEAVSSELLATECFINNLQRRVAAILTHHVKVRASSLPGTPGEPLGETGRSAQASTEAGNADCPEPS